MRLRAVAALLLLLLCSRANAAEQVPPERTALLVLRILAFDRNLLARSPESAAVAIVTADPEEMPEHCRDLAREVDNRSRSMTVLGLRTRAIPVSPDRLEEVLGRVTATYICADATDRIPQILTLTRKARVLSVSDASESAQRGVSITIVARGNRPKILLNLDRARQEGADFDSALLRVAEIQP